MSVESEAKNVNEKFAFIKEIYSDSWALIIGINKYKYVQSLNYAADDAVDVKKILIEKYGFKESNIKLLLNLDATKDNILKGFNDILTQAKSKDRVLVFYAGHGDTYNLPSGGEMGFLIPTDGDPDNVYLSCIKMDEIYSLADMSYAKHILYLVDACYGGLSIQSRSLEKEITPEYLKKLTSERGRQIITAGGKNEQVIENPKWGHSAFTKSLLNGLGENLLADENEDGIITASELGGFIKSRVIIDVSGAHTPQQGRIGSDMGEFVFISEDFKEELAEVDNDQLENLQKEMEAQKESMKVQQEQMEKITELLLAQAQQAQQTQAVAPVENYPRVTPESKKPKKPKQPANMKTASTLAWAFPGMGHYYSGRSGKGVMFTGLELAALSGVAVFSANFADESDNYDAAVANYNDYINSIDCCNKKAQLQQEVTDAFNKKQGARISLISAGSISVGVWLWNIIDIKKSKSKSYSSSSPVSIGINSRGEVEARFSF